MRLLKWSHWQIFLTYVFNVLLCLSLSVGYNPSLALADSISPTTSLAINNFALTTKHSPTVAFLFRFFTRQPKRTIGVPTNTGSAGRRGKCNVLNQSFVALVPRSEIDGKLGNTATGFTTQLSPTLLVHFPDLTQVSDLVTSGTFAELMIQQLQGDVEVDFIQPIRFPIAAHGGITEVSFKELDIKLAPAQAYHWYLSIVCDLERERPSRNPSVDAWIETIDAEESQRIESEAAAITEEQARVEYYLAQEIWHEPAALLAKLRCQDSNREEYKDEFKELLSDLYSDNDELKVLISDSVEAQTCPTTL